MHRILSAVKVMLLGGSIFLGLSCTMASYPPKKTSSPAVIAYYTGQPAVLEEASLGQLTHIIYSFLHLKGNELALDNAGDSTTLAYVASLKKTHPDLKVMVSLGGWGGCETCSPVFSTEEGRKEFALSTKRILKEFKIDGIDLDWEYPTIEGYPGHQYLPEDKENFTALVKELRKTLGKKAIVTFAAGGFEQYLEESVNWDEVMKYVDFVNIMSYDLVNGNSTVTGHHTPLYSTDDQVESTDNAVQYLKKIGVAPDKMVIGAAFYGRVWENVTNVHDGLYQSGKFKQGVAYRDFEQYIKDNPGYVQYYDSVAQASYWYNADAQIFLTHDDSLSVAKKTQYVIDQGLKGIMFWVLGEDRQENGLLDVIDQVKKEGIQ